VANSKRQELRRSLSILIPQSFQNFLKKLLITKGRYTYIISPFRLDGPRRIFLGSEGFVGSRSTLSCYGGKLSIGSRFYATRNLNIYCGENIVIGDDVLIGSYVLITDLSHGIDPESDLRYQKQPIVTRPVSIGSGCWLGDKVSILPGTSIGDKCVIGANSVVRGKIPAFSMVAGNPAVIVKTWNSTSRKWIKS
jgi:acetyltransferase-like isoleucine patch superfamily enzyme